MVLTLPTGAGKTFTAIAIVRRAIARGQRVLWLAHLDLLLGQAATTARRAGLEAVAIGGRSWGSPTADLHVASMQTLGRRLASPRLRIAPDLIVVDEAHRAMSATYVRILERWPQARVLGLTATPWRTDGKGLGDGGAFQSIVAPITPEELIEGGFLVPVKAKAPWAPTMKGARRSRGEFTTRDAEEAAKPGLGDVIRGICETAAERPGLRAAVFAASIRHSQAIVEQLNTRGVPAAHVDGQTPSERREELLGPDGRIASGEVQIVSSVGVLDEGVDCPVLDAVVLASPTASSARFLQRVGRGLRPAPGKTDCLLLDYGGHIGAQGRHWWPTDDISRFYSLEGGAPERRRAESPEDRPIPTHQCRGCYAVFPSKQWPSDGVCPMCGVAEPPPAIDTSDKGLELQDVGQAETVSWDEKRTAWAELVEQCTRRGYKPGWASMRYKRRFGYWPSRRMLATLTAKLRGAA